MSSLLEHIARVDRHRAALAHAGYVQYTWTPNRVVITAFTQDRERSVEYWSDDAYADAMTTALAATLVADPLAGAAHVTAQRRIRRGEARLAGLAMTDAWYALTEAWNGLVRGLVPPAPQSAFALTPGPHPVNQYRARGKVLEDITIDGAGPITAERHGPRRRYLS